jgi:hypothetical protein
MRGGLTFSRVFRSPDGYGQAPQGWVYGVPGKGQIIPRVTS